MKIEEFPTSGDVSGYDWEYCFSGEFDYSTDWRDVGPPSTPSQRRIKASDVAEVVAFHASWNDGLDLVAALRLNDGSFAALTAWTDYTGWGCREGITFEFAPDLETLKLFSFGEDDRSSLFQED